MVIDSYKMNASSQYSYEKATMRTVGITNGASGDGVLAASTQASASSQQQASAIHTTVRGALDAGDAVRYAFGRDRGEQGVEAYDQGGGLAGVGGIHFPRKNGLPMNMYELKLAALEQLLTSLTERGAGTNAGANAQKAARVSIGNFSFSAQSMRFIEAAQQRLSQRYSGRSIQLQNALAAGANRGMQVKTQTFSYEREAMSYSAAGVVKTADGRTIDIEMQLNMSREFAQFASHTLNLTAKPVDPLVINYGGTAASLTQRKFQFDLDADGVLDEISFAGAGSGFLALDKNGDGVINDGSELFGPGTGNGFDELRAYDADGNGWIDEADEIFSKLKVWSKDENGRDQLFSLKDLGIGAIYLGAVTTDFAMQDARGNTQGQMRSTSFFLREDGGAGYVHHIDIMA